MDQIALLLGYGVMVVGGLATVAALLAAVMWLLVLLARRLWNYRTNIQWVRAWMKAGQPRWQVNAHGVSEMRPTVGSPVQKERRSVPTKAASEAAKHTKPPHGS